MGALHRKAERLLVAHDDIRKKGQIVAFANIRPSAAREEVSVDLMRCRPEAPNGDMDYLFIELMTEVLDRRS